MEKQIIYHSITGKKEELLKTIGLVSKIWPWAKYFNEAYLNWEYNDNPLGRVIGYNAYCNEEIIGHYAAQPVEALINGNKEIGLLSLNTAVHSEFRGKGIFQKLAKETFNAAITNGYRFVYGVSNKNSTLPFVHSLGFNLICPLDVKIGIGIVESWVDDHKDASPSFRRVWDNKTLSWRFNRPGNIYCRKSHGSGSILFAPTSKYGIYTQICALRDNETLKGIKKLWRINPISLWIGVDDTVSRAKKMFFYNLPDWFRPSPLNLIFKDLLGRDCALKKENIKISLLDFDAY